MMSYLKSLTWNITPFLFGLCFLLLSAKASAGNIAYIHGDISACGTTPSSAETAPGCSTSPFDQMLLEDTGSRGLSQFVDLVEGEGHSISSFYDQEITLNSEFFADLEVVVFGLHQKIWSGNERQALYNWLETGGGMLIYSDSASGGSFQEIGAQNPVGQNVTGNLLAPINLQVSVDQANGVRSVSANSGGSIEGLDELVLEGEGVSPVAIAPDDTETEVLIPFNCNGCTVNRQQGLDLPRVYAALVLRPVGQGHVSVMFDRQPIWNSGPGSDINQQDNGEILRRLINFLAIQPLVNPDPDPNPQPRPNPPADDVILAPILQLMLDDDS